MGRAQGNMRQSSRSGEQNWIEVQATCVLGFFVCDICLTARFGVVRRIRRGGSIDAEHTHQSLSEVFWSRYMPHRS